MWLTDMAYALRSGGLAVIEVPGWQTRGYLDQDMDSVRSIITHWTATPSTVPGNYPTLGTILNGNANTPGPLAQLGLGRDGTYYACAAGLCNHAGVVDSTLHSNPNAIGIEAEYHPDQGEWPQVQQDAFEQGCAVLSEHYKLPVSEIQGHYEVARPIGRKPDPNTIPGGMPGFRQRVRRLLEGDDMFGDEDRETIRRIKMGVEQELTAINGRVAALTLGLNTVPTGVNAGEKVEFWRRVWTERLAGDNLPDGAPFDEEAWHWLVDRARDDGSQNERLKRLETLIELIARQVGVTLP